jgi:hypothetical protein
MQPPRIPFNKVYVVEKSGKILLYPDGNLQGASARLEQALAWYEITPTVRLKTERVVPYISVEALKALPRTPQLDQIIQEAEAGLT